MIGGKERERENQRENREREHERERERRERAERRRQREREREDKTKEEKSERKPPDKEPPPPHTHPRHAQLEHHVHVVVGLEHLDELDHGRMVDALHDADLLANRREVCARRSDTATEHEVHLPRTDPARSRTHAAPLTRDLAMILTAKNLPVCLWRTRLTMPNAPLRRAWRRETH